MPRGRPRKNQDGEPFVSRVAQMDDLLSADEESETAPPEPAGDSFFDEVDDGGAEDESSEITGIEQIEQDDELPEASTPEPVTPPEKTAPELSGAPEGWFSNLEDAPDNRFVRVSETGLDEGVMARKKYTRRLLREGAHKWVKEFKFVDAYTHTSLPFKPKYWKYVL